MRQQLKRIPIIGEIARKLYSTLMRRRAFPGSATYWERRYLSGGDSGVGSYSKFADFKAEVINGFITEQSIRSVIEFGCGDGNQIKLVMYPQYLGIDVSETAIAMCRRAFAADPTKTFKPMAEYAGERADLGLSLDVMYHLVEESVFAEYVERLFNASMRYVMIYSSDCDDNAEYEGTHVFHRRITKYISLNLPGWGLIKHIPNRYPYSGDYKAGSFADFFIYKKM